jgi:hypothetical protein
VTAPADLLRFIFIADAVTSDSAMVLALPDGAACPATITPACSTRWWMPHRRRLRRLDCRLHAQPQVFGTLYLTGSSGVVPGIPGWSRPPPPPAQARRRPRPAPSSTLWHRRRMAARRLSTAFCPMPFWTLAIGGGFLAVPSLDGNPACQRLRRLHQRRTGLPPELERGQPAPALPLPARFGRRSCRAGCGADRRTDGAFAATAISRPVAPGRRLR